MKKFKEIGINDKLKNRKESIGEDKYSMSQKLYFTIKRILDIMLSSIAIVILSPLLGVLSIIIKLDSPGPILFKQKRVGKNKELFEIWKFRTMYVEAPKNVPTHLLTNSNQYITRIGKVLRSTSMDELPQLFNIIAGKMSFVGPRPALWNQVDLIKERDKYSANDVKPGLTGWAQINGRDELDISDKARYDGEYVGLMGLKIDCKCLLGTFSSVISHKGIKEGGAGEPNK